MSEKPKWSKEIEELSLKHFGRWGVPVTFRHLKDGHEEDGGSDLVTMRPMDTRLQETDFRCKFIIHCVLPTCPLAYEVPSYILGPNLHNNSVR